MFQLLRRKFFSVILVIGILLLVVLTVTFYLIYHTLMNDYTTKTVDFADKVTADMQTRTEYTNYIAELFVKEMETANPEMTQLEFASDVNRIKIFNQNIQGAIHIENNIVQNTSTSEYIRMFQELRKTDLRGREPFWTIEKTMPYNQYLFLVIPYEEADRHGFFAVDTSGLKKGLISDNLFFEDATVWLSAGGESLRLMGEENEIPKQEDSSFGMVLRREIQEGMELVFQFPMTGMYQNLRNVLIWMILLALAFMLICSVVVRNMVNQLTGELEQLKEKMDKYARSPVADR
ncbi:MAG: hypothetical protein E7397_00810 [Ruminococcaceae bacterium]|nr:hypothetical protein [Oscillospiraceae bacterium]